MKYLILFGAFISMKAFSYDNHCENTTGFQQYCKESKTIKEGIICIISNYDKIKDLLTPHCLQKSQDIYNNCPNNVLDTCNKNIGSEECFEDCLMKSKNNACAFVGQKYHDESHTHDDHDHDHSHEDHNGHDHSH